MANMLKRYGPFVATYTAFGPVHRKISYRFNIWLNMPAWFNAAIGTSIAWRTECCLWWLRLVDYGTPAGKCLTLLWFMMLAARLTGIET